MPAEDKVLGYALALLPIIGAHVCIPPISYLRGKEPPPISLQELFYFIYENVKVVNPGLMSYNYVVKLLFNNTLIGIEGNEYKCLTYMFVHSDYSHLLNNLFSAINLGFPIYEEFGVYGLYSIFLAGGVIAVLPSPLHDLQNRSLARDLTSALPLPDWDPVSVPGRAKAKTVQIIAHLHTAVRLSCGSSGGVYALLGARFFIFSKKLYAIIKDKFRTDRTVVYNRKSLSSQLSSFMAKVWTVFQDKRFWELSYDTASLGLFILSEFNIIYEIPRVPLSVLEVINVHTVGHASHVQGALVGLAWVFLHSQYFAFD